MLPPNVVGRTARVVGRLNGRHRQHWSHVALKAGVLDTLRDLDRQSRGSRVWKQVRKSDENGEGKSDVGGHLSITTIGGGGGGEKPNYDKLLMKF